MKPIAKKSTHFPLNEPFGAPELCFWVVGENAVRIQTREPCHREALHKLPGFRRVAYSCTAGYLLVYQGPMAPVDAAHFVAERLSLPANRSADAREGGARFQPGRIRGQNSAHLAHRALATA